MALTYKTEKPVVYLEKKQHHPLYAQNQTDRASGNRAEQRFLNWLYHTGKFIKQAEKSEDYHNHWDVCCEINGKPSTVEIKSLKHIRRKDWGFDRTVVPKYNSKYVWLEIRGVNGPLGQPNPGWIYGGTSDYIAFEQIDGFLIIEREKLVQLCDHIQKTARIVYKTEYALYNIYVRNSERGDQVTLVEVDQLMDLNPIIIKFDGVAE